jgi:excinuclease ABC subunit C
VSDVTTADGAPSPGFDGKVFVRSLRHVPGVYRMLDATGEVLYVGKAADLAKRVGSYFLRPQLDPRLMAMVSRIAGCEVTVTRTEAEALLLENELIKSLKPRYNVLLRDDKSYPYIYLSDRDEFPRLAFHRGARRAPGRYFGPFPSAFAVRESLNLMQKLFRVRQCEDTYFRSRSRPCLQHQIGRCTAPCVGLVTTEAYARDVRHASLFLDGKSTEVIDELVGEMDAASAELEFERAALLRDQIANLKQVQARQYVSTAEDDTDVLVAIRGGGLACVHALFFRNGVSLGGRSFFPRAPADVDEAEILGAFVSQYYAERTPPRVVLLSHAIDDADLLAEAFGERSGRKVTLLHVQRGERTKLIDLARRTAEQALATERASRGTLMHRFESLAALLGLAEPPERIECFDVSHTFGEASVASCVVFGPEGPIKTQYRRYNITGITPGDDYGGMRQALERRFRRAQDEGGHVPDVLLIDGGRGQVEQARVVLADLALPPILIVGVAKGPDRRAGDEELVFVDRSPLHPPADHAGLHLIQQVRDEAHRFAITGHRARRQKSRERSALEDIPGIGARRRSALLKHFGGLAGVQQAGIEELQQVRGIDREIARRIYDALHG